MAPPERIDIPLRGSRRGGWVVLFATVVAVAITARLGVWQLDRADTKNGMQAELDARSRLPALANASLARTAGEAELQNHRAVVLHGRWLAERTIYLDNRQMDGRPGFFVVTPLALEPVPGVVLVQRGWVLRSFVDRAALPPLVTPAGDVSVAGSIAPPPSRLYEFADAASGPIRQNLDIGAYARETGLMLLPLTVLQHDDAGARSESLLRHWPAPASDVQKHYGYAAQWFAMAAGVAFLYVWHRYLRPAR